MIFRITNLQTEKIGAKLWRLTNSLVIATEGGTITVPKNFITDGASCPRILWSLCSPMSGLQAEPAVVHDWLYSKDSGPGLRRKQADQLFYDAMIAEGVSKWRAKLIYRGVRMGGMMSWKAKYSHDKIKD